MLEVKSAQLLAIITASGSEPPSVLNLSNFHYIFQAVRRAVNVFTSF